MRREIEKRLDNSISNSVPDVLDEILTKCEKKKKFERKINVMEVKNEKKKFSFSPKLIGAVATAFVVAAGVFGINRYSMVYKVYSTIEFDVNPSIEVQVNKKDEIIKAIALNDDAKKVLKGMDLEDVDLNIAVNAILGSMLKNGYITADANSILVSVQNDDEEKRAKLQERVSKEIESVLKASSIDGAVLTQSYGDDADDKEMSDKYGVSEGKAKLINSILASGITDSKGNAYTFENLSNLSINDLNLLLSEKKTDVKNVTSTGTASVSGYITRDKAKQIAFGDAGVSESNVYDLEVEFDADDGRLLYEIEFKANGSEYEYDIHARTGEILVREVDKDDDYRGNTSNTSSGNNYRGDDDDWDDRYDDDDDDDDWDD